MFDNMTFAGLRPPVMVFMLALICPCCQGPAAKELPQVLWEPFRPLEQQGLLGERLDGWREKRLWYVADTSWLLSGFESRPGSHAWQGEHLGKWLHAAVLAHHATRNDTLKKVLDSRVAKLLAAQLSNGYLGTYSEDERFYADPEAPGGWDIWTHRYNLYGLLAYEQYHPNERVVYACRRMGDLLMEVYGPGQHDITAYGTRKGISSTCLMESMALLYGRTKEGKYLDFAEQIVAMSEKNPDLRLMDAMLHQESVVYPGEGKAYQLMANLLGYYQLYLHTGKEDYFRTAVNGWEEIRQNHLLETGGPWTRKRPYNANAECFALPADFEPGLARVENCCTVTWIQLNLHLFELTGLARYADEAERAFYNQLLGAHHPDGMDWCYFTRPNETARPYDSSISCCASSGPRALEMFASHQVGAMGDDLCISGYAPSRYRLPERFGGGTLKITGQFPYPSGIGIEFETVRTERFIVAFRIPSGTRLYGAQVNGKSLSHKRNERNFYQASRKWRPGDVLRLELTYALKGDTLSGQERRRWVAFSCGPLVLSQEINAATAIEQPFLDRDVKVDDLPDLLAMPGHPVREARDFVVGMEGANITLIPYYLAGTRESGPRTYFEYKP
jgi:DUF1680 family protein